MEASLRNENALLAGQKRILELIATGAPLDDTLAEISRFIASQEDTRHGDSRAAHAERKEIAAYLTQIARERAQSVATLREAERQSRELLRSLPVAVYQTDAQGRLTYYNDACTRLAGRTPTLGSDEWCVTWKLRWPDGKPMRHDECPMAVALNENRAISGGEAIAERPDGERVPFMAFPVPLHDASGMLIGAVNTLVDITERKQSEESLRKLSRAAQQLAAIVESSKDAIVSKDLNAIIQSWNRGAEQLFGYRAEEAIGKSVNILIPPGHEDEEPRLLAQIRRGESIEHYDTVRQRKDGTLIDISLTVSPIRDSASRIVGVSQIARDISERRAADKHRDLLIHELSHRVKNALATVQSIATQSFATAPTPEAFQRLFMERLIALAHTHDLLMHNDWRDASLRKLIALELTPYRVDGAPRWSADGEDVQLDARTALALGMALHELATNAAKHGALSVQAGRVSVCWQVTRGPDDLGALQLSWTERDGPHVEMPSRRGFGSRLIEKGLRHELDADVRLDFKPAGVCCAIDIPFEPEQDTAAKEVA